MRIKIDQENRPVRVVQITDAHLGEEENSTLLDMNTDSSLEHVLQMLLDRPEQADLIMITGDIADHGARTAYERFQNKLSRFQQPQLWLNGNHDVAQRMRDVVGYGSELSRRAFIGNWQLVMLDSVITGKVGGSLAQSELQYLRNCLSQNPDVPTLIGLHHHPIPVGCEWLDEQIIDNADEFLTLLKQFSCVKAVCWGHVHQDFSHNYGDIAMMSSPSTCVQFAPNSDDFKVDDLAPGVRWLELYPDGRIETEVLRVTGVNFSVDLQSTGYVQEEV